MAIGYSVSKESIDSRLGAAVVSLRNSLDDIVRIKLWLDETSDAALIALGYSQDDVNLARASFNALNQLRSVGYGQATVASADNFFFFAKRIAGVQ
jgi:hypothetical protein